jgi:hypothetical protein
MIQKHFRAFSLAGCTIVMLLVFYAECRDFYGDNYAPLIVSQSLIENHTVKLDAYRERLDLGSHSIIDINGHLHSLYPPGTPIFSLPAVMVANTAGLDMLDHYDRGVVQIVVISFLSPIIYLIILLTGRYYVSSAASLAIATVSFMGSSMMSILGSALWSHNFMVLFISLCILLLARYDTGRSKTARPYLLAFLMFSAYLCRPTAAVFIVPVFAYLFFRDRKALRKTTVTFVVLLLSLAGFLYGQYGQPLPPYYLMSIYRGDTATALYGILLSPSKGILIFSPFLIPVFAGIAYAYKPLVRNRMFLLALGSFFLHLLLLVNCKWWGGHGYGPRLVVDSFPALTLITFILWQKGGLYPGGAGKHAMVLAYLVFGALAIWINVNQGLYNVWGRYWNSYPDINSAPETIALNWKYPQFLASADNTRERILYYMGSDRYVVVVDKASKTLTVSPRNR